MPGLAMSPQVFSILSGIVAEYAGLHFDVTHAAVFGEKVATRAAEAGFESLLDYYYFLRYDKDGPRELQALTEALVVGETYLFRELAPLQTLVSDFVAPVLAAGRRPRVWCAACATGEEPHTLAMLLAARNILDQVDLVASDINDGALVRARSGRFSRRAIRQDVPAFAQPWLQVDDRGVTVGSQLTEAIDWRRINLMDDAAIAALGTFDVVLCRNVLIYFNDDTARAVAGRLAARLRVGGALFVGISESLIRLGTPLVCEEQNGIFLYKMVSDR
jgi:chemotaxis protein methyltransferase CheR